MDDKRFDALAKRVGTSRRSVLKKMVGLGGAAAVASLGVHETEAARRGYSGVDAPTAPDDSVFCPEAGCCAVCPNDIRIALDFAWCVGQLKRPCAQCIQESRGCRPV